MIHREKLVEQTFNPNIRSLPDSGIAYVPRDRVAETVEKALRRKTPVLYICGYLGVGKSSAMSLALKQLKNLRPPGYNVRDPMKLLPADLKVPFEEIVYQLFKRREAHPKLLTTDRLLEVLSVNSAFIVLEDAQGLAPAVHQTLVAIGKAAGTSDFRQFKVVAIPAVTQPAAKALIQSSGTPFRPAVDYITIPHWKDETLEDIVSAGAELCKIRIAREIVSRIAAFSCGIPAATHLLSRALFLKAADSSAPAVNLGHQRIVLGNRSRIGDLMNELVEDATYATELREKSHVFLALLGLAGRLREGFTTQDAEEVLKGFSSGMPLLPELDRAVDTGFIQGVSSDRFVADQLVCSVIALLELQARALHRKRENVDEIQELLDRLLLLRTDSPEVPLPPVDPEQEGLEDAHALVIGVGDYVHSSYRNLPATVQDAKSIAQELKKSSCGYKPVNVKQLTGPDATLGGIRTALENLAQRTDSDSTVFIYFSGHGGQSLEDAEWTEYLCPREANAYDLPNTALSGDEFSRLIAEIPARRILVILDACHAGGALDIKADVDVPEWKTGLSSDYYEELSKGAGRVIFASSKADQCSHVQEDGQLSIFTGHLLDAIGGKAAIRGDGFVHVLDVFHYVNEAVTAEEPEQTPILKASDLELNFPIALSAGGKGVGYSPPVSPIDEIREEIVRNPINGAKELSDYLQTRPEWVSKRDAVDMKRSALVQLSEHEELYGLTETQRVEQMKVIYFLLTVCQEVAQED